MEITLCGEQVILLAERALWWPAQKTLIIADLHWGKAGHFRKNGIAIPANTQPKDEIRLAVLVQQYKAERLIVAGDLFHSVHNKEVDLFGHWRKAHQALQIDLVMGNHDILPAREYAAWGMQVHEGCYAAPFYIVHDMPLQPRHFIIHGHLHPAVRIIGRARQSLKLCCFCQDEQRLILPAFGQFTGSHVLDETQHKHLYVIAEKNVLQWK